MAPIRSLPRMGIGRQLLPGTERTKKTFEQTNQRIRRRLAAPQARLGVARIEAEDIDKAFSLAGLDRIRF